MKSGSASTETKIKEACPRPFHTNQTPIAALGDPKPTGILRDLTSR
jgi:hypothetical protein